MRDFNLFPIPGNLLTLERKYGDALSYEDINGCKQKRRRRRTVGKMLEESAPEDQSVGRTTNVSKNDLFSETTISKITRTDA